MPKVINVHQQSQILGINAREIGNITDNDMCVWGRYFAVVKDEEEKPTEPEAPKRKRRTKAEMEADGE